MRAMVYLFFLVLLMVGCGESGDSFSCSECSGNSICNAEETACVCKAGYEGESCLTNSDDCSGVTCENGGSCIDGVNSYSCECVKGYEGDFCETGYFITTWKTDNEGISEDNEVTIPTNPEYTYNYDIDCNSDGEWEKTGADGDYTCVYEEPGEYQISIRGDFPHLDFYWDFHNNTSEVIRASYYRKPSIFQRCG